MTPQARLKTAQSYLKTTDMRNGGRHAGSCSAPDPVGAGVVESLARPGGNATGLSLQTTDAAGKRLELLRDVVPGLRRVAIMVTVAIRPPHWRCEKRRQRPGRLASKR